MKKDLLELITIAQTIEQNPVEKEALNVLTKELLLLQQTKGIDFLLTDMEYFEIISGKKTIKALANEKIAAHTANTNQSESGEFEQVLDELAKANPILAKLVQGVKTKQQNTSPNPLDVLGGGLKDFLNGQGPLKVGGEQSTGRPSPLFTAFLPTFIEGLAKISEELTTKTEQAVTPKTTETKVEEETSLTPEDVVNGEVTLDKEEVVKEEIVVSKPTTLNEKIGMKKEDIHSGWAVTFIDANGQRQTGLVIAKWVTRADVMVKTPAGTYKKQKVNYDRMISLQETDYQMPKAGKGWKVYDTGVLHLFDNYVNVIFLGEKKGLQRVLVLNGNGDKYHLTKEQIQKFLH